MPGISLVFRPCRAGRTAITESNMQTQLSIVTTYANGTAELHLKGRLNSVSAEYTEKAVMTHLEMMEKGEALRLNLSELTYLASAGLRIFVLASKSAHAKGINFSIAHVPKNILEVLRLTGLTGILVIEK